MHIEGHPHLIVENYPNEIPTNGAEPIKRPFTRFLYDDKGLGRINYMPAVERVERDWLRLDWTKHQPCWS